MKFRIFRRGRKPEVIITHADLDQRGLLCRAAERWGYEVRGAADGLELTDALSVAFRAKCPPAAVAVSVDLPTRPVVSALASIRRWDWSTVIVLLHDGRSDLPEELLGVADGVVRPLAVHELRRALAQLLPRDHDAPEVPSE